MYPDARRWWIEQRFPELFQPGKRAFFVVTNQPL
jgi:hypothetical protein